MCQMPPKTIHTQTILSDYALIVCDMKYQELVVNKMGHYTLRNQVMVGGELSDSELKLSENWQPAHSKSLCGTLLAHSGKDFSNGRLKIFRLRQ